MEDGTRLIPLTQGYFAKVDEADYEWLNQWKWCVRITKGKPYAVRREGGGSNHILPMHSVIAKTPLGYDTDHRNGDSLDNRRGNLRCCTRTQNNCNNHNRRGGQSKFVGVYKRNSTGRWAATIKLSNASTFLGEWATEEDAALARDAAARIIHGEFASLNFPGVQPKFESIKEIQQEAIRLRWIRLKEPAYRITHNGDTRTIAEWSAQTGLPWSTIRSRMKKGLSPDQILKV